MAALTRVHAKEGVGVQSACFAALFGTALPWRHAALPAAASPPTTGPPEPTDVPDERLRELHPQLELHVNLVLESASPVLCMLRASQVCVQRMGGTIIAAASPKRSLASLSPLIWRPRACRSLSPRTPTARSMGQTHSLSTGPGRDSQFLHAVSGGKIDEVKQVRTLA